MDTITLLIVLGTFISWGAASFIAKLATNKIGVSGLFWDRIGSIPFIIVYCLSVFKLKNLIQADKAGIMLGLLTGLVGSFGAIGFYLLLDRADASSVIPLTALYPALTVVLAFVFLQENVTTAKIIGIFLSLIAIYLLSS